MTNRARHRLSPLFDGADAGNYTLPEDVLSRRALLDALEAERTRVGLLPVYPEAALLDAVEDAVEVGEVPTNLVEMAAELQSHHAAAGLAATVLNRALDNQEDRLVSLVMSTGDRLIVDHLRVALLDTLDSARRAARVLKGALPDPASLAAGHVGVRVTEATKVMNDAATRYAAIRTGRRVLSDLGVRATEDTGGAFGELANLPQIWPGYGRSQEPPWPTDPPARLLWLVAGEAQPWMPTPAEQDARWRAWHQEVAVTQAASLSRA